MQDFAYEYDLAGNILALHDRAPASGLPAQPDRLDRSFTYDPLYRLLSATGRECDLPTDRPPWDDRPRCADVTRARGYTEQYQYDAVGNMLRLGHRNNGTDFVRQFALAPGSNRLATLTTGQAVHHYIYDGNGNLIQENSERHFAWDHSDRMKAFHTQVNDEEPSIHAHYLYDMGGQRVKKLVRKQDGRLEVTVYIDGLFEHHRLVQGTTTHENNTLHVMDSAARIAMVRVSEPFPDDTMPAAKYHLGDHLGSSNVVIDQDGSLINREEYTPYGETSFGSFAKKRYRFTGKERDEESGLAYHGARYYAPWIARWISCDPVWLVDGSNPYAYSRSNPMIFVDTSGAQPVLPEDQTNINPVFTITSEGDFFIGSNTQKEWLGWTLSVTGQNSQSNNAIRSPLNLRLGRTSQNDGSVISPLDPKSSDNKNNEQSTSTDLSSISMVKDMLSVYHFKNKGLERLSPDTGSKYYKVFRGFNTTIGIAGDFLGAVVQHESSTAQTTAGRYADTALGIVLNKLIPPGVGIADMFIDRATSGKISIGQHFGATSRSVVTLGEAGIIAVTQGPRNVPIRGLQTAHRQSLAGEWGTVMQLSSALGESLAEQGVEATINDADDYWGEYGLWGGLKRFWNEI